MHFVGWTPSGHEIHWDSGPQGAITKGSAPMETFLHATAVCGAMDVVNILRKRRKEITTFEVAVEGDRALDHPRVFRHINISYRVKGPGITQDEVQKALNLSCRKYCSITNMLKPDVKVSYRIEVPVGNPD